MVRMKRGNGSMSNTNNLELAYEDFKSYLNKKIYVMYKHSGRAKDPVGFEGVVSIICYTEKPSPLGENFKLLMEFYNLIYKKSWYSAWRKHCNIEELLEDEKYRNGFTLTENIWHSILEFNRDSKIEHIIRFPNYFVHFSINDMIKFQNKYHAVGHNQNDKDNPVDYGFPALIAYKNEYFKGSSYHE